MTLSIRNTNDLRKILIETIQDVRKGKLEAVQAKAVSALSSQILQSARLDLEVLRHSEEHKKLGSPEAAPLLEDGRKKKRNAL